MLHCHELVGEYYSGAYSYGGGGDDGEAPDLVIEAQWRDLRSKFAGKKGKGKASGSVSGGLGKLVPLCDVSGSMSGDPMLVSIALGILISEVTHPLFRDRMLTFESQPSWVVMEEQWSLKKKVAHLAKAPWGGSTDFGAAMDMILDHCVENDVAAEDLPEALVVLSDMQFNCAGGSSWDAAYERVEKAFVEAGYADGAPHLIFWNLRATGKYPAFGESRGVSMVSGFSPNLLKLFMDGEDLSQLTPLSTMRKAIDDARYDDVRALVAGQEGGEGKEEGAVGGGGEVVLPRWNTALIEAEALACAQHDDVVGQAKAARKVVQDAKGGAGGAGGGAGGGEDEKATAKKKAKAKARGKRMADRESGSSKRGRGGRGRGRGSRR